MAILRTIRCSVLSAGILALALTSAEAVVWNVNPGGTGDAPTIQAAFDAASPGDLILLAPGTYTDSHSRATPSGSAWAVAHMTPGVSIQGSGADMTIIDGQSDHHGLVGTSVGTAEVSDLAFLQCHSRGLGGGAEKWGGGLLVFHSSVSVRDCKFVECVAQSGLDGGGGGGGGIFLYGGSGSFLEGNLFVRCSATDIGGGVEVFLHNGATIQNNTFVANHANRGGGGLLLNNATTTVDNNIFATNSAGQKAGGIWCLNSHTETGACNLFWQNTAPVNPHVDVCTVLIGASNNVVADPMFCDAVTDNYSLFSASPAAPANSGGCGLKGAFGVACGPVPVESTTWGSIKSLYR